MYFPCCRQIFIHVFILWQQHFLLVYQTFLFYPDVIYPQKLFKLQDVRLSHAIVTFLPLSQI